ncbi:MAG: phosphoribosylamine--glycine ligase [Alphaproteobacteria bacterium]|nr:phosphoribosylamine--glycine ligase [Alphaproteobacteria bacterium]
MKILLVGSGGREHALAWKLAQSPSCETLYCAPGNPGIESVATCVKIDAEDVEGLTAFAVANKIDLVVVGPEGPLVAGLASSIAAAGIPVFGPSTMAAQLEGSKAFMKDLCAKYGIPTAAYGRFTDFEKAAAFIETRTPPIVVKTDGLAAGKGVLICMTHKEAREAAQGMLSGQSFGKSGTEIIIEQFLDGEELSYFALADGKTVLPFGSAQDHKRAFDGDKGPNTGGMGAYSPAHMMNAELEDKILARIITPTVEAMAREGAPFTGVLFAGIMVVKGEPLLIEFNARFGDPECQTLMMRLQSDLVEILNAGARGHLAEIKDQVRWAPDIALCVVMAANGYPGTYVKNTPIQNLDEAAKARDAIIFHAGTARNEKGEIMSTGGRVLGITARGKTVEDARKGAYATADMIEWPEGFYRRDIGARAL